MIYQLIDEYSLINYLAAGLAKVLMAVLVAIDQFDLQVSNEKTTNWYFAHLRITHRKVGWRADKHALCTCGL
jgi:hypothetical protein